jgi:hypothetical protein
LFNFPDDIRRELLAHFDGGRSPFDPTQRELMRERLARR